LILRQLEIGVFEEKTSQVEDATLGWMTQSLRENQRVRARDFRQPDSLKYSGQDFRWLRNA
jgi:hypothetical protein